MHWNALRIAAGAAAIALVVVVGAAYFARPGPNVIGGQPSGAADETQSPSVPPSALPSPSSDLTTGEWSFVVRSYGLEFA